MEFFFLKAIKSDKQKSPLLQETNVSISGCRLCVSFTFSLLVLCIQYHKENSVVGSFFYHQDSFNFCFLWILKISTEVFILWIYNAVLLLALFTLSEIQFVDYLINFSHGLIAEFLDRLMNFY